MIKGDNLLINTFEITTESPYSPFQMQTFEEAHSYAIKARPSGEKQLQRLIKKFPRFPQLQNYLSVYYHNIGKQELAYQTNDLIIKRFPDYLHGKINKANQLLTEKKIEDILNIFPPSFNLKIMYPERESFHISEVFEIGNVAVRYFIEIKNYDQAEIHLGMLKELGFNEESVDYLEILLATSKIVDRNSEKVELQKGKHLPATSKTVSPQYKLSEIEMLFSEDELSKFNLKKISKLARKDLIDDLNILLNDAVNRFSVYSNDDESYFVINAMLLCGEIEAEECLEKILKLLSQNEEMIHFYFGDYLTEMVWEVLFRIGKNKIGDFVGFLKDNENYTFAKTEVARTLAEIYLSDINMREDIKAAFKDVLNFYLESKTYDSTFIGLFICSIDNCALFPYFRKEIENLLENDKVDVTTCGTFSELSGSYNNFLRKPEFRFFS